MTGCWLHNFRNISQLPSHAGLLGLAQFCESSACENNNHFPSYKPLDSMPNSKASQSWCPCRAGVLANLLSEGLDLHMNHMTIWIT
jgi:hypothetical protein